MISKQKMSLVRRLCLLLLLAPTFILSCSKSTAVPVEEQNNPALQIYVPNEFQNMDLHSAASTWSYTRSKQSEHFIVFWGKEYGTTDPGAASVATEYRVDIDDLLAKAEQFYALNINTLGFAERGVGKSNLDTYKMMIFLHHTTDWMAYGGGYDDVIGALWISPSTCKPVGATIAHEIGHSFQYQVRCDLGVGHGFRYGFGGNGGNGFWEQTAQWQAHQSYPLENFNSHHFSVYTQNYHRHQIHELYRYANYFIHHYWADRHGIDIIGRIWRGALEPEDPIQAYKRITGINDSQFNDQMYDAASKFASWDINSLRDLGQNFIGKHTYKFDVLNDGRLQVTNDKAPGTTGYNVVPLEVPAAGTEVTINFEGFVNEPGFNAVDNAARAGWRYGFVALLSNGNRVYGTMHNAKVGQAKFTVPSGTSRLWFVVTGAPTSYKAHAWDDNESNDEQWPYRIAVQQTNVVGYLTFDADDEPSDIVVTQDVSFPLDATNYTGTKISVDQTALGKAFLLQPSQLTSLIGNKVKFYAVEPNGTLNATTTANGYGHWFGQTGAVVNWGANAFVFSEFNENTLEFSIGQYPNRLTVGETYTIKQALVYEHTPNTFVKATFVFRIKVT
ncbi:DUF4859 domain-containing protein [Sphingobacterium psychroaquaticum]|uniref:DUF4859 domain-containing protein n=1 Tax=Sphingobacterium psychroaquaticum TaxID=561061 RepID=UPI001F0DEC62|nr:DUF4859 domain-containing protein [Sphingobacterium psychroaquaticum]